MCHVLTGKQVVQVNVLCGCDGEYTCPAGLPINDEIKRLEEHTKILQDRIDTITRKITGLKTVKES